MEPKTLTGAIAAIVAGALTLAIHSAAAAQQDAIVSRTGRLTLAAEIYRGEADGYDALRANTLKQENIIPEPAAGPWRTIATSVDISRLDRMSVTRAAAINAAMSDPQFRTIQPTTEIPSKVVPLGTLGGRWLCRTIKLGGLLPLVIYGYFKCEIADQAHPKDDWIATLLRSPLRCRRGDRLPWFVRGWRPEANCLWRRS